MTTILLTGGAGFIGFHTAKKLMARGDKVILIDNLNDYYDVNLKKSRIEELKKEYDFKFYEIDFSKYDDVEKVVTENKIDKICHLGAQAGVRYSIENPFAYIKSNIDGTLTMFEIARHHNIKTVVYASSSSVYGGNEKVPFCETDKVDTPISLYAATKKSNELMAHTYHHLYGINMTGLRFFTVYGPWGRPDMALFKFTKAILDEKPIDVYNNGKMRRDFTFVTDIVDGVISSLDKGYACEIFNLGNSNPVELGYFIECIEKACGKEAIKNLMPMQPGDVPQTYADTTHSYDKLGYEPKVNIKDGIEKFVKWYKEYYL